MNITGKFLIFVEDKKGKENNLFKTFSTNISTKQEDGSYVNKSIEVRLDRESFPSEVIAKMDSKFCYELEISESWLSARQYTSADGSSKKSLYLYVKSAACLSKKKVNKVVTQNNNDLPF